MTLEASIADLDEIGSVNPLAKAVQMAVAALTKGSLGESWAPNGGLPANTTRHTEPSATSASHAQTSMGGSPEAKRAVPAGENGGGYSELDEPSDGKDRIGKAKKKAKGTVPEVSAAMVEKSCAHGINLQKAICPHCDHGAGGDAAAGGAEAAELPQGSDFDNTPSDAGDSALGSEPPAPYDDGSGQQLGPQDGDEQIDPVLAQLMMALEQQPQLAQALLAVISGGETEAAGRPAPAPVAQGQTDDGDNAEGDDDGDEDADPRLQRSFQGYREDLHRSMAADPRRDVMYEAIDAAPALEAFMDHIVDATAKSMAIAARTNERQNRLLDLMEKSLAVQVEFAKSMAFSGTISGEPIKKSLSGTAPAENLPPTEVPDFPDPGVLMTPFAKALGSMPAGRDTPISKELMVKSLTRIASDGGPGARDAANMLGYVDLPEGIDLIKQRATGSVWKRIQEVISEESE